jgi:hypothetical protein
MPLPPASRGRLGSRNSQQRHGASNDMGVGDFMVGNARSHARPDPIAQSTGFRDRGSHQNSAGGRPGAA